MLIDAGRVDASSCATSSSLNVALLGVLSRYLAIYRRGIGWRPSAANLPREVARHATCRHFERGAEPREDEPMTRRKRQPVSPAFHPASAPDYVPPPQFRDLQSHAAARSRAARLRPRRPFRRRMDERGVRPDDIARIDDIARLPFTVKTDLRDTYPFGLFASPMGDVVRLHASSGTTGKPIVVAYTQARP